MMIKPQPRITVLSRPFWQGCNEEQLVVQWCSNPDCGKHVFYPRVCCPFCKTDSLRWVKASGLGRVISHTVVRRTHHDSFNAEAPYVFAAIEIQEGPCLYAQLLGAPPEEVSLVGRAVVADFVDHGPEQKILAFRLSEV
jgi:uncharacterized OB-fold protein